MGGEVEGNRKALLPGGQVAAIKGVGFFRGRETGILTDCPWAACIHRRTHTACERRKAGKSGVASVRTGVQWLHRNALGRMPGQVFALNLFVSRFFPVVDICHYKLTF